MTGARSRRVAAIGIPVLVYVALSVAAFWPVNPVDPHFLPVCNCADYAKMAAFLEWTPWAILHAHNPFLSTYQDYPTGVNMATNTTMPFLGVVLSPITLTVGPIAAMNILARVALFGSATTAFVVFRRWTTWTPAAFVGGLLFGFSPYMLAHSYGHPNLIFVVLLPVLLYLVADVLAEQKLRPRRAGILLGLVAAAQYGISSELLADAVLVGGTAAVLLALIYHRQVRDKARHALRALGWSLAVFVPLTAYPIYLVVAGPGHLTGPVQSVSALERLRADLLGAVLPTKVQLFSFGHVGVSATGFAAGNYVENAVYIGIPLLALVVGLTVAYRRVGRLVFMSIMVLACYIASLGVTVNVDGRVTPVGLPFRVLVHLPLLDGAIAVRFFVFGYLFLAASLAIGMDHLHAALAGGRLAAHGRRWVGGAICLGAAGVALLPLLPNRLPDLPRSPSAVYGSYAVPTFFSQSGGESAIPQGSPALLYPYSTDGFNVYSVLWQAVGGERFRLTDGDATIAAPGGAGSSSSPQLEPPLLENLLLDGYFGPTRQGGGPFPVLDRATLATIRLTLARYGYSTVVVVPVGKDPAEVVHAITAALGVPPARTGEAYAWYGVQEDLHHLAAS